ncbi:S-layer homology domain-containing protein [Candidatus Peregrinibacteria bacterium]|nr:S-layer homology domain-containing protein [Candidatus Peregrinibacteria bacterium]
MKNLKTLFASLLLAVFTTVTAFAQTVSAETNLRDFFIFPADKEITFNVFRSTSNILDSTSKMAFVTGDCAVNSVDCVTYYGDGLKMKFWFANGDVKIAKVNKDVVDALVFLSMKPVKQQVPDEAFAAFGLDYIADVKDVAAVDMSCTSEKMSGYNYNDGTYDVIKQDCSYSFTDEFGLQTVTSNRYFLNGLGLKDSYVSYFRDEDEIVPADYDSATMIDVDFVAEDKNASKVSENFFVDVTKSHKNYEAIVYLFGQGIAKGYEDYTFRASEQINRAELLKLLIEAKGDKFNADDFKDCFYDVKGKWYESYACYAKSKGWIDGYKGGKFDGGKNVNKVEAVKMLLEVFEVPMVENVDVKPFDDVKLDRWYTSYIATAKVMGLLEMDKFYTFGKGEDMRRGEMAESLYRLLTQ